MRGGDVALAVMAALAGFLLVGIAVTEAAAGTVEFSLLIGLPAGAVGGLVAFVVVYRGLGSPRAASRRRAFSVAAFGTVFLSVLLVAAAGLDVRNTIALLIALTGAILVATAVYVRGLG